MLQSVAHASTFRNGYSAGSGVAIAEVGLAKSPRRGAKTEAGAEDEAEGDV